MNNNILKIIPALLTFFVMGFVDLVGIATNYIKVDFALSDTEANMLPSMVFFWFLVLSIPTSVIMTKLGRRNTSLLSLVATVIALIVPFVEYSFGAMFISFALLGIGNTLMQVSLNPLVSDIVSGKKLASMLTLGQFIKAISAFLAPILAAYAVTVTGDWKSMYIIFAGISIVSMVYLGATKITESQSESSSSFKESFSLLGDKSILMLFCAILVTVGLDVGINITAPKLMMERFSMPLSEAGYTTSLYFIFRTVGCLVGALLLSKVKARSFFLVSIALLSLSIIGLLVFESQMLIYVSIALLGLGNANIFSLIFAQSLNLMPEKGNQISGLMIMGVAGGAIFPPLMGLASDSMASQMGAVIVLALCVGYLWIMVPTIKSSN